MKRREFINYLGATLAFPGMVRSSQLTAHDKGTGQSYHFNPSHPNSRVMQDSGITGRRDTSFYLSGNFAPVHDEITVTDLEVKGELTKVDPDTGNLHAIAYNRRYFHDTAAGYQTMSADPMYDSQAETETIFSE